MSPATITLLILAGAAILFITEIIPLAVTAMSVAVILFLTGVLDVKAAMSGLMDNNVILFAGMFVVGAALFETGVAKKVGDTVIKFAKTENLMIIGVMTITCALSSVLSNTGTLRYSCLLSLLPPPPATAVQTFNAFGSGYRSGRDHHTCWNTPNMVVKAHWKQLILVLSDSSNLQ